MNVTVHPKNLVVTAVFIVAFGSVLSVAADFKQGVLLGVLGLSAYLLIEIVIAFNPSVWLQDWRQRNLRSFWTRPSA